jgi:predicted aminopeptidase
MLSSARSALLTAGCVLLSGCGTAYLLQAASGQWQVLREREPIARLLTKPDTPGALRAQLAAVQAAREFASRELKLPDNKSYRSYADIGREFVVWNVVAAPEFAVEPRRWCFPVAGCVAYRGYFHEARARQFAAQLAVHGYDVAVDGVPAYSTLGKFADPVLSSMLIYGDDELAATIFHELAHQLLYVRDDSEFNEAFATTVEDVGLERWLTHLGALARLRQYRERMQHAREFAGLLAHTRARLATLYASAAPRETMRERKALILHVLAADMRALEVRLGVSYPLYEEWIAEGLNNARLASVSTYYDCVPGFARLLRDSDNELERFYAAARALSREPRAARHQRLCGDGAGASAHRDAYMSGSGRKGSR